MKDLILPKGCKFSLTADLHVENNKNLPNIIRTAEWIRDTNLRENIDWTIIIGDFINAREKIDVLALNKAIQILNELKNVILLLGNHEYYSKITDFKVTCIRPFEKHAHVIDSFRVIEGDTYYLYCVPFIESNELFNNIIKTIYGNWPNNDKKKILLGHQPTRGAVTNDLFNVIDKTGIESTTLDKFDHVFMGHYHKYQQINKVTFVGSPVQLSFGEEHSQKGLTIWDSAANEWKFIENPYYECYKTIVDPDTDVKDKFVRYITNELIDSIERQEIKNKLFANGAKEVYIEVRHREIKEIAQGTNNILDLKKLTREYIKLNSGDLDDEKLFNIGAEIKSVAKERLMK